MSMKLGVFPVMTPDLTPEEFVATCKEVGIQGIDWRYKDVPPEMLNEEPEYHRNNHCFIPQHKDESCWKYYKDLTEKNGMVTSALMNYARCPDVENTEEAMAVAKYLGSKHVRISPLPKDHGLTYQQLHELFSKHIKNCAELCKKYGVKGLVETHHGSIPASVSCAMDLVRPYDPDVIGILFDPGNMVREGYEDYKFCIEMMGPYLAHVHVKNVAWQKVGVRENGGYIWESDWALLEQGMANWEKIVSLLKLAHYDGFLSLEDFGAGRSSKDKIQFFKKYIGDML